MHQIISRTRTAQVLANIVEAGFGRENEASAALREGHPSRPSPDVRAISPIWVAEQLADFAGNSSRDITVTTTLDVRLQAEAEASIAETLARDGAKAVVSQGALVAMTPDGAVRAMVGGRDYNESQFNRATQAQRQPGSAFKPFVYLAGLEAGLRPSDNSSTRRSASAIGSRATMPATIKAR